MSLATETQQPKAGAACPACGLVSPPRMSFEEYLTWDDEGQRAEWVNGELVCMSPVSLDHQRIIHFLLDLLQAFIRPRGLGEVFFAPIAMRLPTRPSAREPDLLVVLAEHADRLKPTYVDGPADLVVEVVSPDSGERDRGTKLVEYEGGRVPEYWLVDPLRQDALFYQLGADGRYRRAATGADGFYRSAVLPGFRLKTDWLWQRPLPNPTDVLAETGA